MLLTVVLHVKSEERRTKRFNTFIGVVQEELGELQDFSTPLVLLNKLVECIGVLSWGDNEHFTFLERHRGQW